jgi:hypothetical protein
MSRYQPRHRQETQSLGVAKRVATTASFGVVAVAAIAGTSATAWACPTGAHDKTSGSVHHAVTHSHSSSRAHTDATRGASPSDPDGMSNGGADKPWGAAAANDDVDGNNGSGNDTDCEDDNNGVGTPGHCRVHDHGSKVEGSTDHGSKVEGSTVVAVAGATGGTTAGAQVLGEQFTRSGAFAATSAVTTSAGAGAVSPSSTSLPFTGSDDLPLVALIGGASVLTGAGVVRAARRRKPMSARPAA